MTKCIGATVTEANDDHRVPNCPADSLVSYTYWKKNTIMCMCVDGGITALNEKEKKDYHIGSEWREKGQSSSGAAS